MSANRESTQKKFNLAHTRKNNLPDLPKSIQQYLQFMDYKIRKQLKSFTLLSLCGGAERGNFIIQKNFERAFSSMSLNQKTQYYSRYIQNISQACNKLKKGQPLLDNIASEKQIPQITLKVGRGNKTFEETQINFQDFKVRSKNKIFPDIDVRNYLLRKSKKKNLYCYALQAMKPSEIETIRFQFLSEQDVKNYLPLIQEIINKGSYLNIQRLIYDVLGKNLQFNTKQIKLKNDISSKGQLNKSTKPNNLLELPQNPLLARKSDANKSVIQDIVKQREEQQLDDQLTQLIDQQNQQIEKLQLQKKKSAKSPYTPQFKQLNRNIFRIILPNFNLKQLSKLHHYGSIYQSKYAQMYAYINVRDHSQLKLQLVVDLPAQIVCKAIYNVQLYKYWHQNISQGQIKLKISSENSCITYLKAKAFSQWYRQRDYLLLTHMFKMQNCYYIVEKSIQNANFIPFQSITRGKFNYLVWRIQPEQSQNLKDKKKCKIIMEMKADHQGLLNKDHQKQLSIRFVQGFQSMQAYYQKPQNQKKLSDVMNFNWLISDRQVIRNQSEAAVNGNSLRTCDFQNQSQISNEYRDKDQIFYSIQDLSEEQKNLCQQQKLQKSQHQLQPGKNKKHNDMIKSQLIDINAKQEQIITNAEGLIILPQKYIKRKFKMVPFDFQKITMKYQYEDIIQKDHWQLEKCGGLKLINQQKINAQNNVLKFIMKTLKKNIFSGKGVLNISLPVQIFNIDSNLQRICLSMSLGPQFLEPVIKSTDKLERFRRVLAFGLSNSVIFFDVEKPFNPILGETYQGYIRGCPIYAEQISHHPPITSVYFVGRGYKVTASLQAKVNVHINSGDGLNEGFYHIKFDDGSQIIFQTPPGELSGLAVGQRRYNFKDRGIYLDLKNNYFCEMRLESGGGLFNKKKRQFADQIQGDIVIVKPEFIKKFMAASMNKKPSPSQSDIVQKLDELSGRWPIQLKIGGKAYYNIKNDVPDKMIDQIYPLNSNSNYRQDLYYRKKEDLSRSQIQKQRLEVIQRGDRKLRQKFHGPAHH